jgi:amino acid permease
VFPVSIPRELSALRFTSAFSVVMSFYIVLVIFFEAVLNHGTSPSLKEGFVAGHEKANLSVLKIFNCLPLIIFAFMYQINIPAIYSELTEKSMENMQKIIGYGTFGAGTLYIITGVFGYAAFAASRGDYPLI